MQTLSVLWQFHLSPQRVKNIHNNIKTSLNSVVIAFQRTTKSLNDRRYKQCCYYYKLLLLSIFPHQPANVKNKSFQYKYWPRFFLLIILQSRASSSNQPRNEWDQTHNKTNNTTPTTTANKNHNTSTSTTNNDVHQQGHRSDIPNRDVITTTKSASSKINLNSIVDEWRHIWISTPVLNEPVRTRAIATKKPLDNSIQRTEEVFIYLFI